MGQNSPIGFSIIRNDLLVIGGVFVSSDNAQKEAAGIVLFFAAAAVALIFYLPVSLTGMVGEALKTLLFGLVGTVAYVIPVCLLYAAFDVFFEKRQGVSGIRVRSVVLFLVSVSALLALLSMDMEYFMTLCADESGKASALRAVTLLWQSGMDGSKIADPQSLHPVVPGGVIGGCAAVALNAVAGKIISRLIVAAFLLVQVVIVFRVSIKATAKKTARAISRASAKVYGSVVDREDDIEDTGYGYGDEDEGSKTAVITFGNDGSIKAVNGDGSAFSQDSHVPVVRRRTVSERPVVREKPEKREPVHREHVKSNSYYEPVPTSLLEQEKKQANDRDLDRKLQAKAEKIEETIRNFGINVSVVNYTHGPRITRYELTMEQGRKVSGITGLQHEIMLAMAARSIRIQAPIPGKNTIGIEIPNDESSPVCLRSLVETNEFRSSPPLKAALGRDIAGSPIYCDIAAMPHLLIAGATGSGKSVCINSILASILVHSSPSEVRMILIDPKRVELMVYNGIPHLIMPVVTDHKKAVGALNWAIREMNRRYGLFEEAQVRDITGFNSKNRNDKEAEHLPYILIVIDEMAEIMTVCGKEFETCVSRLAALARASGIHLIVATQRPAVKVITGTIKANIPARIALSVASGFDSRTILDKDGAEKLLGHGDMLFDSGNEPEPVRGQGALIKNEEVTAMVTWLKKKYGAMYDPDVIGEVERLAEGENASDAGGTGGDTYTDELFEQAAGIVIEAGSASTSMLQSILKLGYPRASRLVRELEQKKIIGPSEGSKPRKVLITKEEWETRKAEGRF